MKFAKMNGAGNDFIIFNGITEKFPDFGKLAKKVCDRHFGIGADGILIVEESKKSDIKMTYFNADGSQAEMCGNGIRCFAKYVYDNNIIHKEEIEVETLAGIMKPRLILNKDRVEKVSVNIGSAIIKFTNKEIKIDGLKLFMSYLLMGPPHVVIFVDKIDSIDVKRLGSIIEKYELFPNGANVNFCEIKDRSNISVVTWERGSGQTLACGTGASAVGVIANSLGIAENNVNTHLLGGVLEIEVIDNIVYLTGGAELICEGEYYFDK